jgi:hypothetical protein
MSAKKLLFSVTAKDFDVETFCTGGNGGQHRNAKRNGRDQGKNRKAACWASRLRQSAR